MLKEEELLPIGSVITSRAVKPKRRASTYLVITGRFFIANERDKTYFDYECNYYPGGTSDGTKLYMNHDLVEEIIFKGYEDHLETEYKIKYLDLLNRKGFTKRKN